MDKYIENRREFLKQASIAAAFPYLLGCSGDGLAQRSDTSVLALIRRNAISAPDCEWCGARDVPNTVTSKTTIAGPTDPVEAIVIAGTVYRADGKTPASDTLIYFYHTDVDGIYGRRGEHIHGRYRGWALTDTNGRYELRTIKPAPYPNSTNASHIHMTVTGTNFKEDWIDSVLFEGDRLISPRQRIVEKGGFNPILSMKTGPGRLLFGTRDIQLPIGQ
ncbi:MAG: hypothetical protein WBD22_07510 [Pyrinomonadaceae bacterium]